jgi:23S rRNA (uracil-5-)-methyltransferase RumA
MASYPRRGSVVAPAGTTKRRPVAAQSASRYIAPCPHYPHCIGCPFIDLPYPEQLIRKRKIVAEALIAYPSLAKIPVPPVIPSPRRLGYRGRVKLVVRRNRGEVALGLYAPGSHRVRDISSCPVHPQSVNRVAGYLKGKIRELNIAPYDERDDSGDLRYVDIRCSFARRELSVTLVTRHASLRDGATLARDLQRRFPFIAGVIQNVNEQRGNVIWGDRYRTLSGSETIAERICALNLVFPAGVFAQANPFTAAKLYEKVGELAGLTGKETVLDLYSGVGPISLTLARSARLVWGIDDNELSISTAKQNARRNGVSNCRFFTGDVAEKMAEAKMILGRIDVVVLNPPRKGVQPVAMEAVLAVGAPKIIYVSCEPKSLARDVNRFTEAGYRVTRIQPFDMFPQTDEVEAVVLLEKR